MPTLAELDSAAPTIAAFVGQRIEEAGLCFLATRRSDGWPRVSPVEVFVHDGQIYLGSMPAAVKVLDLRRDARCCLITPLADKDDLSGEAKLFCQAREVGDLVEYEAVRASFLARRGFDMGEMGGAHLFALAIEGAAWQRVEGGDTFRTTSWHPERGVREFARSGAAGERVEL